MKKILFIISVFCMLFAGVAYTVNETMVSETVDAYLNYTDTYKTYIGASSDTIGVGDSIWEFKYRKKSNLELIPYTYLSLDSTGGTSNSVTITLESKVFPDEDYKIRETINWTLGQDTALTLVSDTSHISEYWKIKIIGADDTFKAKVLVLNAKFIQ